jgi:hypothetical protein
MTSAFVSPTILFRRRAFTISRREAPESCIYLSPPWRAWGMPGAHCTRGLVCTCSGRKHTSNNEYTGTPDIPARNGFNSLCRALPGDRALLPPSPRGYLACPHPVGPTCLPQNLTPASGRQDHTILPSAATSLVSVLFDRSRIQRTRPAIPSPARRCRVHRIPSRVRDDRDTPLCVGRDARSCRRDLGYAKTEIFLQRGLDSKFADLPVGQISGSRRGPMTGPAVEPGMTAWVLTSRAVARCRTHLHRRCAATAPGPYLSFSTRLASGPIARRRRAPVMA